MFTYIVDELTTLDIDNNKTISSMKLRRTSLSEIYKEHSTSEGMLKIYKTKYRFISIFFIYGLEDEECLNYFMRSDYFVEVYIDFFDFRRVKTIPDLNYGFHFKGLHYNECPGDISIRLKDGILLEITRHYNANTMLHCTYGLHLGIVGIDYESYISNINEIKEKFTHIRIGFMFTECSITVGNKHRGKFRLLYEVPIMDYKNLIDDTQLHVFLNLIMNKFKYGGCYFDINSIYKEKENIFKLVEDISTKKIYGSLFDIF
jgi:hypothetical protein